VEAALTSCATRSPDTTSQAPSQPVALAVLGAVCVSPMPILVILADAGPVPTAFYRCIFALPLLAAIAVAERRRYGRPTVKSRGYAVLAGLLFAVDLVFFNHTVIDIGASMSTVIGSMYVPLVVALAWAVLGERPGRRFFAVLPLVLAGVVLASGLIAGATGPRPAAGVAYAVAASVAYSCFLLILRGTAGEAPRVASQVFDATVGATLGTLLFGLAFGGLHLGLPWQSLGWLLLLALTVQTAGWLLITSSLPGLPAAVSSLLLLLQPAASMILAAIILGQRPSLIQILGALLVCGGVLIAGRSQASESRRTAALSEPIHAVGASSPGGSPASDG
jgi:drug/metabolite transporter (DMT)-like permease